VRCEQLRWFAEPEERSEAAGAAGRARSTNSGRILVVDDENAIRLICRLNLQTAGFDTLEAGDGATALELARAEHPDLVLLDIMLPEVDGWAVAEEMAADPDTREIPILFLTARSEPTDISRGHELGGVGYVTKPFDPVALTETVSKVLERARRGELEAMRREWEEALRRQA
jgi:two-component system alkaline phosphatase synthesis response regulator PhoP